MIETSRQVFQISIENPFQSLMKGEICFQSGKSSQHASGKSMARQDHPASGRLRNQRCRPRRRRCNGKRSINPACFPLNVGRRHISPVLFTVLERVLVCLSRPSDLSEEDPDYLDFVSKFYWKKQT